MGGLLYTPTGWVDDDGSGVTGTQFTAARMNNLENGIEDVTVRSNELDGMQPNLHPDGSFDGVSSPSSPYWTWASSMSSGGLDFDEAYSRTGKGKGARATITGVGGTYAISTRPGQYVRVPGSRRVTVCGWVRCNQARSGRIRALFYDDANGTTNVPVWDDVGDFGGTTTVAANTWTYVRHTVTVPNPAVGYGYARLLFYPLTNVTVGDVWDFDDFGIYLGDVPPIIDVYDPTNNTFVDFPVDSTQDGLWKVRFELEAHYSSTLYLRLNGSTNGVNETRSTAQSSTTATSVSDLGSSPTGMRFFNNFGAVVAGVAIIEGEINIGRYRSGSGRVARGHVVGMQSVGSANQLQVTSTFAWRLAGAAFNGVTFLRMAADQQTFTGRVWVERHY